MADLDEASTKSILSLKTELEKLNDNIIRAAEGRRELPVPLGETLKKISELLGECEDAIKEHIATPLSPASMELVINSLDVAHESVDSLIVFDALEGTVFNTETVAND
ncbi:hypothetical protein [Methyloferula stellata]|uniref:hypothetical protein n=1 Tax=Methyloferula stellata TaxID=876270 RepID=UPI0003703D86|nr:hypothetical protein [Methyloferula stellata]